jgi:hypothetical protein
VGVLAILLFSGLFAGGGYLDDVSAMNSGRRSARAELKLVGLKRTPALQETQCSAVSSS